MCVFLGMLSFFFFNDTATTEIYTLSLHDALPICDHRHSQQLFLKQRYAQSPFEDRLERRMRISHSRSEEHTSELQSQSNLVCRLLLEKKKKKHRQVRSRTQTVATSHRRPRTPTSR